MVTIIIALMLMLTAISCWLTGMTLRYALRNNMIDQPNERSSHCRPIPRGGGAAFSILIIGVLLLLLGLLPEFSGIWIAMAGGSVLVAVIGWLDDRKGLPVVPRSVVHVIAASWAVYWLGGLASIDLGFANLHLGMLGSGLAILAIVWSVNLFNFMDGIDGLAATQTVVVGAIAGLLCWITGHNVLALCIWIMGAVVGGFLPWNWSPARIFMGDCGSGLLGFLIGTVAIASEKLGAVSILTWCILMGVFLVDATATLLRRVYKGERWYEAHCSHAYQRAVQAGLSHSRVVALVVLINLLLGAMAVATLFVPVLLVPVALGACVGLLLLWHRVGRLKPGHFEATDSFGDHQAGVPLLSRAA